MARKKKDTSAAASQEQQQQEQQGKISLIAEPFDGVSIVAGEAVADAAEDATGVLSAIRAADAAATTASNVDAEGFRATLAGPNVVNKAEHPVTSTAAADEVDADDIMRKYDRESNTRIWEGAAKQIVSVILVLFSLYCIGMTLFSTELPETRLARFLGFIVIIGYIMYPANKKKVRPNYMPWYDVVLMVLGAAAFFYFAFNAIDVINLRGRIELYHVVLGVIGILVVAELCRRCVGIPILVVVGCLLAYALYYFIGVRQLDFITSLSQVVNRMFYSTSGIIGTPIDVCYKYIVLFIIFGAFLERTGIAAFFISLANRIAGWSSGGAAKVAVISSALCGMVSGSSVGNTVTTGSVTIPMMKKTGYKPEFAGAVEAASSTGGQIMPPIMGAAAFLMAEYMGIPYIDVAAKAIIPALLYFTGIFITVHLEAKKLGLQGIPRDQLPKAGYLIKNSYLILPLVLLVWLVASGTRTMAFSAAISILGAMFIGAINFFLTELRERGSKSMAEVCVNTAKIVGITTFEALRAGARSCVAVAVACAMAGLIAGCITVTGLASTLINVIVNFAGDATIIGLVLTMLTCIVLGMGVPTTANYCIMAATTAPILVQLGIPMVAAHFFVFYFGIVADITPPVALAAYAGSAIAKSNPMRTGVNAAKLAIAAFIVPYILAFNPVMILEGSFGGLELAQVVLSSIVGLFGVASALNGNLFTKINPVFRVLMAAGGIAMMVPGTLSDIIGVGIILVCSVLQYFLAKRNRTPQSPAVAA